MSIFKRGRNSGRKLPKIRSADDGGIPGSGGGGFGMSSLWKYSVFVVSAMISIFVLLAGIVPMLMQSVEWSRAMTTDGAVALAWQEGYVVALPTETEQGDVIFYDGDEWINLHPGSAGQVLATNGTAADPYWTAAGSGLPVAAQGDVLVYNGAAWVVLNAGNSGEYLQTQGVGADPIWASVNGSLPSGVQGDFLVHNGTTWVVFNAGADGSVLQTQGPAADPIWAANITLPSGTQGDVLFYNGSNWVVLAAGADGSVLLSQGPGADPIWLANSTVPSGTQGDVLYHNGTAWVVLNNGTVGQVLQTQGDSSDPIWASVNATLPSGVQGNVLYYNGTAWVVLDPGVDGSVLQSQGAGADPIWLANSTVPVGIQGEILYHNGTAWVVLNPGAIGGYLQTQGAGADPIWTANGTLPSGAQGDILFNNGTAWVVLNNGTIGQVLQTQGAGVNPEWATINGTAQPRSVTIFVAAVDATADEKANADYLCDGVDDEVQLQAANDAAGYGTVGLSSGTFDIDTTKLTLNNCTMIGQGAGAGSAAIAGTRIKIYVTEGITIEPGGNIKECRIDSESMGVNWPGTHVRINVVATTESAYIIQSGLLDGCYIGAYNNNYNSSSIGLHIYVSASNGWSAYITSAEFGAFIIRSPYTSIYMECIEETGSTAFINTVNWRSLSILNPVVAIKTSAPFDTPVGQGVINNHYMPNFEVQCRGVWGASSEFDGSDDIFLFQYGAYYWDVNMHLYDAGVNNYAVTLPSGSTENRFKFNLPYSKINDNSGSATNTFLSSDYRLLPKGYTVFIAASDATDAEIFGADVVCNGTADQVEIIAALETGYHVKLSSGTFTISDNISKAVTNVTIEGSGMFSTVIIQVNGGNERGIIVGGDGWTIKNLSLNGNRDNNTGTCHAIEIIGYSDFVIENCEITEWEDIALRLAYSSLRAKVLYNKIHNNGGGVWSYNEGATSNCPNDALIHGNWFSEFNTSNMITVDSDGTSRITGWTISNNSFTGSASDVAIEIDEAEAQIINNVFDLGEGVSSVPRSVFFDYNAEGILMGNTFYGNGDGDQGPMVWLRGANNVIIQGNNFVPVAPRDGDAINIEAYAASENIENIVIQGNNFYNISPISSGSNVIKIWADTGYTIDSILIDSNVFMDDRGASSNITTAIYSSGAGTVENVVVKDNIAEGILTTFAWIASAGGDDWVFDGNIITDIPEGIVADDGNDIQIKNNTFRLCTTPINISDPDVNRSVLMGNDWYGCTNDASTASAVNPVFLDNIDKAGIYWSGNDSFGAGDVSVSGTPTDGQLAIWTDATTIEGGNITYGGELMVAAVDATDAEKAAALASGGYVCDGVDDEVQLQAANDAATGGVIWLSSGTFEIDSTKLTLNNCTMIGQGSGWAGSSGAEGFGTKIEINVTEGITLHKGGNIKDTLIDATPQGVDWSGTIVLMESIGTSAHSRWAWSVGLLDGCHIKGYYNSSNSNNIGLKIYVNAVGYEGSITLCEFGAFSVTSTYYGIYIDVNEDIAGGSIGYFNSNNFRHVALGWNKIAWYNTVGGTGDSSLNVQYINELQVQCRGSSGNYTDDVLMLPGGTYQWNVNMHIYDAGVNNYAITLGSGSVQNWFKMNMDVDTWVDDNSGTSSNTFLDTTDAWDVSGTGGGTRSVTYYIAADDATAAEKSGADAVCDGVSDQTEINAALNDGYLVKLSSGTFNISGTIFQSSNEVTLEGSGIGITTIYASNGTNSIGITVSGNYWSMSDFTLDGNSANNTGSCHGISSIGYSDGLIEFIEITDWEDAGIRLVGDASRWLVQNNDLNNCGNFMWAYPSGGLQPNDITITGNWFEEGNDGSHIYTNGAAADHLQGWTITENTFTGSTGASGIELDETSDVLISGNLFDIDEAVSGAPYAVYISTNSSATIVSGNTFLGAGDGDTGGCIRILGSDNILIDNNNFVPVSPRDGDGIQIDATTGSLDVENIIISNNNFYNISPVTSGQYAIALNSGSTYTISRVNIIGNTFLDDRGAGANCATAIYSSGAGDIVNILVSDNIAEGMLTSFLHILSGTGDNWKIEGNHVTDVPDGIIADDGNDISILNNIFRSCTTPIDINDADVTRCLIMGNNWYGCTNDANTTSATTPRITSNIDKAGAWWSTGDDPA